MCYKGEQWIIALITFDVIFSFFVVSRSTSLVGLFGHDFDSLPATTAASRIVFCGWIEFLISAKSSYNCDEFLFSLFQLLQFDESITWWSGGDVGLNRAQKNEGILFNFDLTPRRVGTILNLLIKKNYNRSESKVTSAMVDSTNLIEPKKKAS